MSTVAREPLAAAAKHEPPRPKGLPFVGLSFEFARDPLRLLTRLAREYGDIVRVPVLRVPDRIFLNHPDWITQVLVVQHKKFHKSEFTKRIFDDMLGDGLLTSDGDFWRRQRRLVQPAFRRSRINDYAATMIEVAQQQIHGWREGEVRDMAEEMMALTLEVAVRALFGATLPGDAQKVGRASTFLMRYQIKRMRSLFKMPANWPTPRNRRARRELQFLDSVVYRIIADRKARGTACPHGGHGVSVGVQESACPGNGNSDVLSLLIDALDEDGTQMTQKQLRDETMTLFLAGHETTALTLAWTWYLLGENPSVEARLHEELRGVLGGRAPEAADLERLPYLQAVLNESLRLYSPAAFMARMSTEPFSVGGYDFPAGTTTLVSQWVIHRDPRFFDDPEAFRPERWLDGLEDRLPSGAYFPFGDGPRRCIGQGFALLDALLVLGLMAQRFHFRLAPGQRVVPEQLITLRPRHGLRMTLHARR